MGYLVSRTKFVYHSFELRSLVGANLMWLPVGPDYFILQEVANRGRVKYVHFPEENELGEVIYSH